MESNLENRINAYAEVFDFYLEHGVLPDTYQEDILGKYIKNILDEPSNYYLCRNDEVWKELLKASVLEFFSHILPRFDDIDRQKKEEIQYVDSFFSAPIEHKRMMWAQVEKHIYNMYPSTQINLNGYICLFQQNEKGKNVIFQALADDWKKAADLHFENRKEELLASQKAKYEQGAVEAGKRDYKTLEKSASICYHYPALQEILHLMGREKEKDREAFDKTVSKYMPALLSHHPAHEEIEGIHSGNELSFILPTEIALLSEQATSLLFCQRYVSKQLLQFSNRPPFTKQEKTSQEVAERPRLQEGPIIVCIDTSASMSGRPEQIAKSLLLQILQLAKRKKRKCFLITYAIRSRSLDISKPQHWQQVCGFLQEKFTGGTDGEMMFADVLNALSLNAYSMADVLLISDFYFPYPSSKTEERIRGEQEKGTRFYGLRINSHAEAYDKLFNRIWEISLKK